MQTLRARLATLGAHTLKEWFEKNPKQTQFILMLSRNNAACFIKEEKGVRLEIAPAYIGERGLPIRETLTDKDGVKWETILVFYEKETRREYKLQGEKVLPVEKIEKLFMEAEEAFVKETSKFFRPSFLLDYVEFHGGE